MEKKLYFKLEDNEETSGIIMELSGVMAWIEADIEEMKSFDVEGKVYTIKPIYLTDEEYDNLPEYDGC